MAFEVPGAQVAFIIPRGPGKIYCRERYLRHLKSSFWRSKAVSPRRVHLSNLEAYFS